MKKPGRPPHRPSEQIRQGVQAMAAAGLRHDDIAAIVGVSDETLRKHYRAELSHGAASVIAEVAQALIRRALGDGADAVNAAKFFLDRRGGEAWREKKEVKHSGGIDSARELTDEELARIARTGGGRAAAAPPGEDEPDRVH